MSLTIVNPTAWTEPTAESLCAVANAPVELRGRRVGLLSNNKPNVDSLHDELELWLRETCGADTVRAAKVSSAHAAGAEVLERLAGCDLVINAIGD
jgi:hypothetical protein